MRRLEEGKKDFRLIGKHFLLVFLIIAPATQSQIYFNGLCRYAVHDIEPGLTSLISLNFNNDYYTDLAAFSGSGNKIITLHGAEKGNKIRKTVVNNSASPDKILPVTDAANNVQEYLYVSRKKRTAGLMNFNQGGYPIFGTPVRFNTYPSNISVGNTDNDPEKEFLISGDSFAGMELLKHKKGRLVRSQIVKDHIYPLAILVDLNSDGFADILAYNLIENKLEFFYNNSNGKFALVKQTPVSGKVNHLYAYNINSDFFTDILFSIGNNIHFLLGDSSSSYKRQFTLRTNYEVHKFIPGDFNRDGLTDLCYLNTRNSVVSAVFQKDDLTFSKELLYLEKEGLEDLIPYYSRFIEGFAALSNKGQIFTLARESFLGSNNTIKLAGNADIIVPVSRPGTSAADIGYLDTTRKVFNLVLRNEDQIPGILFSTPVNANYKNIKAESISNSEKIFYFYSQKDRMIEVVLLDLNNFRLKREFVNCEGEIKEVFLRKRESEIYPDLYVFQNISGKKVVAHYNYPQKRYRKTGETILFPEAIDINVQGGELFSWTSDSSHTTLQRYMENFSQPLEVISLPVKYSYRKSISFDFLNNGQNRLLTFFAEKGTSFLQILPLNKEITRKLTGKKYLLKQIELREKENLTSEDFFNNLYIGKINHPLSPKIYFHSAYSDLLYRLDITGRGRYVALTPLAEVQNTGSYFVENRLRNRRFVVYSDKELNCIRSVKI